MIPTTGQVGGAIGVAAVSTLYPSILHFGPERATHAFAVTSAVLALAGPLIAASSQLGPSLPPARTRGGG